MAGKYITKAQYTKSKTQAISQILTQVDEALRSGKIDRGYARRILRHYGIDIKKLVEKPSKLELIKPRAKEVRAFTYNPQSTIEPIVCIYTSVTALETMNGKKKHRYTFTCPCEIYGMNDGSIIIQSPHHMTWKGPKTIAGTTKSIEAEKGEDSLWPGEPFVHDFKSRSKAVARLVNPKTIHITSMAGKPLWKSFKYNDQYDGTRKGR